MPTAGAKDLVLQTGRIVYGKASDDHSYAILVDSSGNVQVELVASTAAAGTVAVSNIETIETQIFAGTVVAAGTVAASSALSVVGVKKATFFIDHGRAATGAFGTNGTEYRIEASERATGNSNWRPLTSVLCASTACLEIAASADVAAGGTTVVVTSGTSIPVRGDIVLWANTAVGGTNSEWVRVLSVSGTASFVIQDGLEFDQDSDTKLYTQGEHFVLAVDLSSVTRVRAVINNNASGTTQGIHSRIACITEK